MTNVPVRTWNIKGITVTQHWDGSIEWTSGAAVDVDGANGQNGNRFAYELDNKGLDYLANAGYPNGSWWNVLLRDPHSGQPVNDGEGNLFSSTTYCWPDRPLKTRYVDSTTVPYVVINPIVRMQCAGIIIGCRAEVTWNGKAIQAVVADVSGPKDIGEISQAAAIALGFPDCSPRTGGVDTGVHFKIFPGDAAVIGGEAYQLQRAV